MFIVDDNGNITLRQGDSGSLVISGVDTSKNYKVYFAIYDENRKSIISEISVNSNNASSVSIEISAGATDLLTVPQGEDTATYYYGVKLCTDNSEDTLIMGSGDIGTENSVTVYPRKVVGDS